MKTEIIRVVIFAPSVNIGCGSCRNASLGSW